MRIRLALPVLAAVFAAAPVAQEPITAELKYKPVKNWKYVLPNETWSKVSGSIPIAHEGGDGFDAVHDGLALSLEVDTNGDGRTDKKVRGKGGFLLLRGKGLDGEKFAYGVRFRAVGKSYEFASSGVRVGSLDGEAITLIDQDNDGVWNEYGVDALVVGRSHAASYLSRIVNLDGELFEIDVAADGSSVTAKPWSGETGTLDLLSGLESRAKPEAIVVVSSDGDASFELSGARDGVVVPAGEYQLASGLLTKANETVRVRNGKMGALRVEPDLTTAPKWGGEIVIEFSYTREGEKVNIEPTALAYYGQAGEEYTDFLPQGESPKFFVFDEASEKELGSGRFGGC